MKRIVVQVLLNVLVLLAIAGWRGVAQQPVCPPCAPCLCASPTPPLARTPTATSTPVPPTPTPTMVVGGEPGLVIGHLTDLHAGAGNNNPSAISWAMAGINSQADVIVETGDCTEAATAAQWTLHNQWVSTLTKPYLIVAGNHDMWSLTSGRPTAWTSDVAGYRLVGVNGPFCNGAWLDLALDVQPAVVFSHVPLSGLGGGCKAKILAHGVVAYVHGHLHTDTVSTTSGVMEICSQRSGLGHYSLIKLQGAQVTVERH